MGVTAQRATGTPGTARPGFILLCVSSLRYAVLRRLVWRLSALATLISFSAWKCRAGKFQPDDLRMAFWTSFAALRLISLGGILIAIWRQQHGEAYEFFTCSWKVMNTAPSRFPLRCKITEAEIDDLLQSGQGYFLRSYITKMEPGDELWQFCTGSRSWMTLGGRAGYMICRGDQVIASMLTRLS